METQNKKAKQSKPRTILNFILNFIFFVYFIVFAYETELFTSGWEYAIGVVIVCSLVVVWPLVLMVIIGWVIFEIAYIIFTYSNIFFN